MRARRLVGSSLSLMLIATVLVAVGVGSPGRAQTNRVKKQSDPGNSAKDVKERGPRVLPVVGKPEALVGLLEDPKGDGKTPDWFLKTDDVSRAAALSAQKVTLAPSSLSVQTDKGAPGGALPVESDADSKTRALVPELGAGVKRAGGVSKATRRAARIAEGDPVVVEGQDTAKTVRGISSKRLAAEPARPTNPIDGPLSKAAPVASAADAKTAPVVVDPKATTTAPGVSSSTAPVVAGVPATPVTAAVGPVVAVTGGPGVPAGPQGPPLVLPGETNFVGTRTAAPADAVTTAAVKATVAKRAGKAKKGDANVKSLKPEGSKESPAPALAVTATGLEAPLAADVGGGKVVLTDSDDPDGAVQLQVGAGTVGLRPVGTGGKKTKAVKDKSGAARWTGVMADGSDLVEAAVGNGVKGEIVLTKPPKGSPVWDFELSLSEGLQPTMGDGEAVPAEFRPLGVPIKVRDSKNVVVAELPAGVAVDANGVESPLDQVLRQAKNGRWIVQVAVDAAWLATAAFPVRVDPTITLPVTSGTLTNVGDTGTWAAGFPMMISDQYWGYGTRNAYVKFPVSGLAGVSSATLNVDIGNCDAPYAWSPYAFPVYVSSTTSGWNPASVVYGGVSAGPEQGAYPAYGTRLSFNVTNDVQWWAAGNGAGASGSQGFKIRMDRYAWAGQPNYCNLNNVTLDVNYNPPPVNQPATGAMGLADGATGVAPNAPLGIVNGYDPEGGQVYYYMDLCAPSFATCTTNLWNGGWTTNPNWTTPTLPYLQQAQWRAWVWDGITPSATYIGVRTFTTMPRPNGAPTVVQVSPGSQTTGVGTYSGGTSTVTLTASASDPNGDPVEYLFYIYSYPSWTYLTNSPWQSSSTFSFPLQPGTDYAWYVYVHDLPPANSQPQQQGGAAAWWYMQTVKRPNTGPSIPVLQSVANGAVNQPGTPTLSAVSSDPEGDTIQYQYTACPAAGGCVTSPWVSGAWTVTPTLSYNTAYTWSAKARDVPPGTAQAGITTAQSGSWSFTVGANQTNAVTAPTALAPADSANTTTRPMLEINATDGDGDGIEYAFQICSPDFPGVAVSPQCFSSPWVATRYWQPPVDLSWGATYKWRAYARNTSDVTNTVGLGGGWTRTLTPGTPGLNSNGQLAGGYGPNIDIDGGADGAVNEGLGTFVTSAQDAKVASVGPSLSIDRTYNANSRKQGYFGTAWSSNLEIRLTTIPGRYVYLQDTWGQAATTTNPPVAITFGDGGKEYFSQDPAAVVTNIGYRVSKTGTYADLVKNPVLSNGQTWSGWRYSTPDRTILWFNINGYLVKISDRNGNDITYSYVGYGGMNVTQITHNASGRSLTLTYDASNHVASVSTPSVAANGGALVWNYSYTGNFLSQVCPPTSAGVSGCINYDYQNDRLIRIRKPKGNTDVEVTYDTNAFTSAATNLLAPGSFEDAGTSGWYVAGSPAGSANTGSASAPFGSKVLSMPVDAAGYTFPYSPRTDVQGNTTYTLSGLVSGPVGGVTYPYVWQYDIAGSYLGSEHMTDMNGGRAEQSVPPTGWIESKGTFRTFENTTSVHVGFYWPSPAGTAQLDGAMLEKGNGTRGRVLTRKDGMGNITTYSYVQNGANTEVLTDDPRPTVGASKSVYNEKYQIISNTDSANRTTTFTYDANGYRSGVTDPAGRTTTFTNDVRGSVTQKAFSGGGVTKNEYWSYLAGTSFPSEYRDPRSSSPTDNTYKTTYTYDGAGNRTSETDPTAHSVVYVYTAGSEAASGGGVQPKGMLKSVTDRTNITKTFAYAQTGDQVQIVDPARGTTNIGYDEIGRPTSTGRAATGALPYMATTMGYDVRSRVTRVTSPAVTNVVSGVAHQLQVETAYDANGNPITVTTKDLTGGDPQRQVTTTFDNNDRPTQMSAPNGKILSYTYDEVSNVLVATDPRGLQVSSVYDDRNLVTSRVALNYADTTGGAVRQVTLGTNTYDSLGRVVTQADALGRVTETTYTGDGYVRQVSRKNYRQLNNAVRDVLLQYREYDAVGNVTLERSGTAGTGVRTVTRSFSNRNFVTAQTLDPAGLNRTTSFVTDDEGRQLSATTGGYVSSVGYDTAGRPASSTVGGVGSDSVTYDGWGRAVTATNKRGYTTDYVLDIADRIITTRSPDVTVWAANGTSSTLRPESSTGFDTFGGVTHSRDERGLVTVAANDTSGRTTNVTYPADAGITPTESFSYDANDNVTATTDRRAQTSTFTYDLFNRRRTLVGPAGAGSPTSTSVFDDASQLTQSVAPDGSVVNYTYDDLGRNRTTGQVVRQDANAVYTTTNDYDDLGNVVLSINPAGKAKSASYNPAGQVVTATDEIGVATTYGYTPNTGWLASVLQANGRRAATTFDAAGRKTAVSVTDPTGATVFATDQWTYDANSNPVTHTRPNGAVDTYVYDKLDRMVQSNSLLITPAVYGTVDVGYDIAGNQAKVTDPRNNTTTSTYNNWNLVSSTVEPSTTTYPALTDRTWSVGYDAGGLPTSETRPGNLTVSRVFDAVGRMTQETGTGGGSVPATRQFTFDVMGRIATAGPTASQQSFTYDDRGLLRTSTGQNSAGGSSFTYDSVGRMTGRTDGAGSVSFGYTDRGEMNSYTVNPTGGQASPVSLAWNPFGQVSQINYPAGVTRTLGYDGAGRLNDDQTSKTGQGVIARHQNSYNPDGTPSSLVVTQPGNTAAGTYLYTYDAGSRLTNYAGPGGSSAYTYDNAGNRLTGDSKTFTYDERNRLTSGGGTSYTWSARGNRTGVVGQAAFTFDALDRQTGVGGATYTYDSLDRVIGRSVSGVTKYFGYSGFETDPVADGTSSWSRSPSGSVLGQTRAGTSVLVGTERHGDVAWTLNPTTGTIADSTVSDPYGKALSVTGTPGQVGFQGDWTDPLTGLVWMAARWYDTQTATFTSRDTYPGSVGAALTLNRYSYVSGSPLLYNDPTGHAQEKTNAELWAEFQRTGEVASDNTYYENEDGSPNSGVFVNTGVDDNGDEIIESVIAPTGVVVVSPTGVVSRSVNALPYTPNQNTADASAMLAGEGRSSDQIVGAIGQATGRSSADILEAAASRGQAGPVVTAFHGGIDGLGGSGGPSTYEDWVGYAYKQAGATQVDPSKGYSSANKAALRQIYEFYGRLFLANPNIQWLGLAKYAGTIVLMQSDNAGLAKAMRQSGVGQAFMGGAKAIFENMAPAVLAFISGGAKYVGKIPGAPPAYRERLPEAFAMIASGKPGSEVAAINAMAVVEQGSEVLQPYMTKLDNFFNNFGLEYMNGISGRSSINCPFSTCKKNEEADFQGNYFNFDERMKWISGTVVTSYFKFQQKDPSGFRKEMVMSIPELTKRIETNVRNQYCVYCHIGGGGLGGGIGR